LHELKSIGRLKAVLLLCLHKVECLLLWLLLLGGLLLTRIHLHH
jgi:hypothetical protein